MTKSLFEASQKQLKERGREEQGDSVRSAPPGRIGLWFSAQRELQSCGTSSWANTTVLSCTSCSPFAQNGSGRSVPESVLTWNCSTQQAEQVSERREEKNCSHAIKSHIYLHFPLLCFQFQEVCKQISHSNPTRDGTGAHHSQYLQWELVKTSRWETMFTVGCVSSGTDFSVTDRCHWSGKKGIALESA